MTSVAMEAMRQRPALCEIVALQQSPVMHSWQALYEASPQMAAARHPKMSKSTHFWTAMAPGLRKTSIESN
jgi:hypothetical protein